MNTGKTSRALFTRGFGWTMIALLGAFLGNVVLTYWFDFPGAGNWSNADGVNVLAIVQIAFYIVAVVLAVLYVTRTPETSLRADSARVTTFNTFLVRAAFWVVLLIGFGDAIVSFLRVQDLLEGVVGADLAGDLGRADYRGMYLHLPLIGVGILIAALTRGLGFTWLALLVVVAELLIVISRFVFSYEQAFMADLVRFWYGALFLFASAYTLLEDGHVRVDLFYASMRREKQGLVNSVGSVVLGMLLCWTILIIGFATASSVIVGPILVFEVTQSGFGLYVKYFMAGFLGIFAGTMLIQFVAQFMDAVADKRGEPGGRVTESVLA